MNCNECKEQVLELIEREAFDPQGVRETLAKCPECRAEFDEVKAQLAVASQLPLEAPPDHLDILILQAAEARATGVAPAIDTLLAEQRAMDAAAAEVEARPRLFLWRQPVATAAVALLVVGIGISTVSIVRGPREGSVAETPAVEEGAGRATAPDDLEEAVAAAEPARIEVAKATTDRSAGRAADAELPSARQARSTRTRSPKKKEARAARRAAPAPAVAEKEAPRVAAAEADQTEPAAEEYDTAELPALQSDDGKSASAFGQSGQKGATTEAQRKCMSTNLVFEKRHKDNPNFKPTPQQALDAGLCYQMLGKRAEAERWLKRAAEHPSTKARATDALEKLK